MIQRETHVNSHFLLLILIFVPFLQGKLDGIDLKHHRQYEKRVEKELASLLMKDLDRLEQVKLIYSPDGHRQYPVLHYCTIQNHDYWIDVGNHPLIGRGQQLYGQKEEGRAHR